MTENINIVVSSVNLNSIAFKAISYNQNTAQCISYQPTSVVTSCMLASSLSNVRTVSQVTFPFSNLNLDGYNAQVSLSLDTEYNIPGNLNGDPYQGLDRILPFSAQISWSLIGNTIASYSISTARASNPNTIQITPPPSSCFNLALQDSISTYTIGYTANAMMTITDENNNLITNTAYGSIGSNMILTGQVVTFQVSGEIDVNLIGTEYSKAVPCE